MTTELLELETSSAVSPAPNPAPAALDLSYLNAATLMVMPYNQLQIVLVGCGGTGSWLAPHLARISRVISESGKKASLYFVDHDKVEKANCYRQNFADCEIGLHKSRVLALRYGAAWGLDIGAITEKFSVQRPNIFRPHDALAVYIGCVDNAKAREQLALTIAHENGYQKLPHSYWLDCGNAYQSGQVIIGSHHDPHKYDLKTAFGQLPGMCTSLPSPALVEPTLLLAKPEEEEGAAAGAALSCEEMAARNVQSLTINQQIAGIAADYLLRLVLPGAGGLKRFATYIDMASGVARSKYITPEAVGAVIEGATALVDAGKKARGGRR